MVSTAVVLISGDGVASRIAARVAGHLANRRCDTVVYGFNGAAPVEHASVRFATSAGQMPTARDVQVRNCFIPLFLIISLIETAFRKGEDTVCDIMPIRAYFL